jgi:RNA polymerase sigma-70 factor (ECF subfamily)
MTDWSQIIRLYDQLLLLTPSPIVELNRAVAVAELDGPEVALALVDGLELEGYRYYHSTRASLLARLGRAAEARAAYARALELTGPGPERRFLEARLAALTDDTLTD